MIDEKKIIHTQVYDDEHEEWIDKEMTIAEYLDAYTEEGCPESKLQPCEDCRKAEEIMQTLCDYGCEMKIQDAISQVLETECTKCEDAVSREAALKALAELPHEYKTKEQRARTGGIAACQVIVKELPSVTPKQRTGKWTDQKLYFDSSWATCSECKECARQKTKNDGFGFSICFLKYCPNCGAKMEGESE